MKTDFQFSNLLGTVYSKGNLIFDSSGTCLLSPVGNRVTVFDLVNNKSYTLPLSHRRNIHRIALNPKGNLLLTVDEDGRAILTNFPRRLILYYFTFTGPVSALAFSPSGRHLAVGIGRFVEVWRTPWTLDANTEVAREYAPFLRHRVYAGHYDQVQSIEWSGDSRFFLSAGKDLTARVWSLNSEARYTPTALAGHRESVMAAWFSSDQEVIFTISQDGALFEWRYMTKQSRQTDKEIRGDGENIYRWRISQRHFFMQGDAKIRCAAFHPGSNLVVAGFSNGLFCLYELPSFALVHALSVIQSNIDWVAINNSGEWFAFGASKYGQLLVWAWQSESYVLKQQGHFDSITKAAYSPDGQRIVTTADDGKIKIWDTRSGFCVVTFTEHSSNVTGCQFTKKGQVFFTSSLDGSVRAWDMLRYRNFRTFSSPTRSSFSSVAVDPTGEIVCAGSLDSHDIHIWSVQTGQLLDSLSGHQGPVSSLAFSDAGDKFISGSWDNTARIWSVFGRTQGSEPIQLQADVVDVAFRPDSKQVAVATIDGQLTFWAVSEANQEAGLDGRRDVSGGRTIFDRRTAANAPGTKSFDCIAYSTDGACIVAGGSSKYICLYEVATGTLLRKFTVSLNLSLDGTQEFLSNRELNQAGPRSLIDERGEHSDLEARIDQTLPGSNVGDASIRRVRPTVRVPAVAFSPTNQAFCAASTEGLLIYSLDTEYHFDPFDLEVEVTPLTILQALDDGEFLRALALAFRLNERRLIRRVYEATPIRLVPLVIKDLPGVYFGHLLRFLAQAAEETPHLEFNLSWIEALLSFHGMYLKENAWKFVFEMRIVQRVIEKIRSEFGRLAEDNTFTLNYLLEDSRHDAEPPVQQNLNGIARSTVLVDTVSA